MSDKIFYKISNVEMRSDHFYKMVRFVWFRTFIFAIDIYPSEINFSLLIAYNKMTRVFKDFSLWRIL